jgi:hypothetical protein
MRVLPAARDRLHESRVASVLVVHAGAKKGTPEKDADLLPFPSFRYIRRLLENEATRIWTWNRCDRKRYWQLRANGVLTPIRQFAYG